MILIVGLGNPGKKFDHTRHNAGFEALDFFAVKNNFPEFTLSKKYESLISSSFAKASADKEKEEVLLAKPQTFMNESGRAISNFQFPISNLVVVRDDIDLELGKIKFSKDSGSGGHKGVDSIIQHLGNNHFVQLKIGIKTDESLAEDVVLKKFSPEEQKILQGVIEKSAEALELFINEGLEKTMNTFN